MKAPSEKHLEDWITFNLGWTGISVPESWYPDGYTEGWMKPDKDTVIQPYITHLIARQMRLPSGRADLIYGNRYSVGVAELKKDAINADTIAQCLRYMYEMKIILEAVVYGLADDARTDPSINDYLYEPTHAYTVDTTTAQEIIGMVIGYTLPDSNLTLVAQTCGIHVLTYDYQPDTDSYTFTLHEHDSNSLWKAGIYNDYAKGAIGDALRDMMKTRAAWQRREIK